MDAESFFGVVPWCTRSVQSQCICRLPRTYSIEEVNLIERKNQCTHMITEKFWKVIGCRLRALIYWSRLTNLKVSEYWKEAIVHGSDIAKTHRGIQENTETVKKFKSKTSRPCRNEAMSVEHKVNEAGGHDIFIRLQHINYVLCYSASAFASWGTPSPHMI